MPSAPTPPPPPQPPRLSKSRYLSGLQCHKQLWWRVHEPNAPELAPSPGQENLFAQGQEVGERARRHVPGGQLIDLPFYQHDNMVAATRDALQRDVPAIYEAWFLADDVYVGVDILERTARGYGVIEVKASNRRKPEHLPDTAVQVHVLRRAGLPVERAEVMHLNPQCRYPDLSDLFIREDVTALVEGVLIGVPDELAAQREMLAGPLPDVAIGEHCTTPYDCPFIERCWPATSDHPVSSLYRIDRKRARELEADGFATIYDLPSDLELSVIHARQVKAVQSGRMVVEPTLAKALAQFASPLAFLDFETVSLAIPRWTGCRPWQQVPVQFSVHSEERSGAPLVHREWIADGPEDPRPALAAALIAACAGAKRIVAYYASFERDCLRQLREAVPGCARELERIERRLVDLLPVIRRHVYHPDFGGGFSIKKTLPALVPGLSYADLQVQDGEVATVELQRLMLRGAELPGGERAALRDALLRYCERDTWAMVKLLEKLRSLVSDQLELF
jgi:predicted RecB family nuclease